ncbi:hypothetical protein T4B_5226 [Trichinella pseudospiralis]|uniref:Uncharacterized protein n=1 Tax=Trichinella pseudospiralis TaxID=6337 RepID=A0A0V1JES8_TRIPS|nr:hypothetical protein T4B_5226 [Trichinella pseudospiralis]
MGQGHVDHLARVHQRWFRGQLPFQLLLPTTAQVAVQGIVVAKLVDQHPSFGFTDHVTATNHFTVAIQRHHPAQCLAQVNFVVGNFCLRKRQSAEHFRIFDHPLDHLHVLIFETLSIRIDAQRAIDLDFISNDNFGNQHDTLLFTKIECLLNVVEDAVDEKATSRSICTLQEERSAKMENFSRIQKC